MQPKFAPREIFETILEWSVIPTFDLLVAIKGQGVIVVKRKIPPYKEQWALPGLRMYKGETIDATLRRIAKAELGISINPKQKKLLAQYVGKFQTEHKRQDISTAYIIELEKLPKIKLNTDHFYSYKIVQKPLANMGAMYKFYIKEWGKN